MSIFYIFLGLSVGEEAASPPSNNTFVLAKSHDTAKKTKNEKKNLFYKKTYFSCVIFVESDFLTYFESFEKKVKKWDEGSENYHIFSFFSVINIVLLHFVFCLSCRYISYAVNYKFLYYKEDFGFRKRSLVLGCYIIF